MADPVRHFLFWPDPEMLARHGLGKYAHVPSIFRSDGRYHDEASEYLRARAFLRAGFGSTSESRGIETVASVKYPVRLSLKAYGERLCHFLTWCERKRRNWRNLNYNDLILDYQGAMVTGKQRRQSNTANVRREEAAWFLQWAANAGIRPEFGIAMVSKKVSRNSAKSSHGHEKVTVQRMAGKVRQDPKHLKIPAPKEVDLWLRSVRIISGYTKFLICKLILRSAIRIEEAVLWQLYTLPADPNRWQRIGDTVTVKIEYGTKGGKLTPVSLIGKARVITLPLDLANELHRYRTKIRPAIVYSRYVNAPNISDAERKRRRALKMREEITARADNCTENIPLFVSEYSGLPVSDDTVYSAWKKGTLPYPEWSPHLGRHFWASSTLVEELRKRAVERQLYGDHLLLDWVVGNAGSIIEMVIQPQLGHVSAETTKIYTGWAKEMLKLGIEMSWVDYLEGGSKPWEI